MFWFSTQGKCNAIRNDSYSLPDKAHFILAFMKTMLKRFSSAAPNIARAFLALPVLAFSCSFPIEMEFPDAEPKLVVNGLFSPAEAISLRLHVSGSVQEPPRPVDGAAVALYADGELWGMMEGLGQGRYASGLVPEHGVLYSVRATAAGLPPVFAEDSLPHPPRLDSLTFHKAEALTSWGELFNVLQVSFRNVPGVHEFFQIDIQNVSTQATPGQAPGDTSLTTDTSYYCIVQDALDDPLLRDEGMMDRPIFSYVVFKDQIIDGSHYTMRIPISIDDPQDMPTFRFATLSPQLFAFQKSLVEHLDEQSADADLLFIFWNFPTHLRGNVQGGYGIFGGFQRLEMPFSIP